MNRNSVLPIGLAGLVLAALAGCSTARPRPTYGGGPLFEQQEIYVAGAGGYHTYRIPSLIDTQRGTLLAFCEGRKNSAADSGDIDILLKRSTDHGHTWSPAALIADHGRDTVGNPCPVVDRDTGTIWLLLTGNLAEDKESKITARTSRSSRSVWLAHSIDDGRTWTTPVEITTDVKPKDWTWYATGPGCGIQLRSGRLLIPCDHNVAAPRDSRRSHVIYSDDHGHTWHLGGVVQNDVNECQVVELADGTLLLNMRNYAKGEGRANRRALSTSRDGGLTWSALSYAADLIDPICQAAFLRLAPAANATRKRNSTRTHNAASAPDSTSIPDSASHDHQPPDVLLFSNPADTKRVNMTVKLSRDQGRTWPTARQIHAGPSAYSALAALPDGTIGLLYERGDKNPYEKITFARFSLEWLTSTPTPPTGASRPK